MIGPAASTASSGRDGDAVDVTGVASRLFKYLLNDYYEEFCRNVRKWVVKNLKVIEADRTLLSRGQADRTLLSRGQDCQDVQLLRELYTDHVVPDEMVALWNVSASSLSHRLPPGDTAEDCRPALEDRFTAFIVKRLLKTDDHPTLTRFFTFRGVIDAMLTMDIIGLPESLVTLEKIKPKEENQKRLKKVKSFFANPAGRQALRRASLALQLTGGVEAMASSAPKEGQRPKIVDLVGGAAQDLIRDRLRRLVGVMPNDPLLELEPATSNLLATAADLILRFNCLDRYPFILCRLCKKWFPVTYLKSILEFLNISDDLLDIGTSMQLRDCAINGTKNLNDAVTWMGSKPVQELLEQICNQLLCHSLDAERKAAQVKRWESNKVRDIATASMNNICARFCKEREAKALAIEDAARRLRRLRRVNKQSLLWKIEGQAPIGCPFDLNYNPRSSAKSTDSSGRQPKRQIVTPLGRTRPQRMNSFQSSDSLPTEPLGSRQQGVKRTIDETQKCDPDPGAVDALVLENSRLLTEAANDLTRLLQCCALPVTRIQWASWLDENMVEFRRRMTSAFIERRKLSGHSAASLLYFFCAFQAASCLPCIVV